MTSRVRCSAWVAIVSVAIAIAGCAQSEHNYRPPAGYVPDARTAIKIAEAVWTPIYGERQLRSERPFRAQLQGNTWRVEGTLPQPKEPGWVAVGGTAEASIDRRTGKILRVSHGE
jgi:hypothetical protein